jgi:dephospho-CoA kinase
MFVVGLTGGIGCGKSAVTDRFGALGIPIIDADETAREAVRPGQPALAEITEHFGKGMLLTDGSLDRKRLRDIIFDDPASRKVLEDILHPRIRHLMWGNLDKLNAPYAIMSIPLLLETNQAEKMNRILVVDCPVDIQISRIRARDGITRTEAEAIIGTQCSRETRLSAADDLIDNSGSIELLDGQVRILHEKYLTLARQHEASEVP